MSEPRDSEHALYRLFEDCVQKALRDHVSSRGHEQAGAYLAGLLSSFLHTDKVFAIQDRSGRRLASVTDMLAEADVRLNADSFEREREVHKHIGDFILFWQGVYPEFLRQLRSRFSADLNCDYSHQGRESYRVVSSFDHKPYDAEAGLYRQLSEGFEDYAFCLGVARDRLGIRTYGAA